MSYIGRLWIGFACVLSVLLTAMAFLSVTALRLDRAEAVAKQQAAINEHLRLALWRMDSALAPLLAQENAHPQYRVNASSRNAAARWPEQSSSQTSSSEIRLMSAASDDDYVLLRFQYDVDAPDAQPSDSDAADKSSLAQDSAASSSSPKTSQSRNSVDHLAKRIPRRYLLNKLPDAPSERLPSLPFELAENSRQAIGTTGSKTAASRSAVEFQQRNQSLMSNNAMVQQLSSHDDAGAELPAVMMTPVWASGEMILARRVQRNGGEYVQGCLLDWRAMRGWLLEMVNLIDNACKYAAGASDRRICLTAYREGRYVVLRIRDYGPGIPVKRRWFRPFDKSVQEAAHSAPGIGLGLALSRRLAKQMGGRLDVDHTTTNGAALLLRFPTRKAS